jgi:hypothetical protein
MSMTRGDVSCVKSECLRGHEKLRAHGREAKAGVSAGQVHWIGLLSLLQPSFPAPAKLKQLQNIQDRSVGEMNNARYKLLQPPYCLVAFSWETSVVAFVYQAV